VTEYSSYIITNFKWHAFFIKKVGGQLDHAPLRKDQRCDKHDSLEHFKDIVQCCVKSMIAKTMLGVLLPSYAS
jgi:hypothetical protein